ncbi:MAG: alpha/beta hydrolase [Proteobacteria bacterium]|nr:alpha/beta hydrolase [Pseudomonadota bacterium]
MAWHALGTHPLMTKRFVSGFVKSEDSITPEILKMYQAPLALRDKVSMMGDWLADFFLHSDTGLIGGAPVYSSVRAPVRIIWGELDPVTPLWQAEEIRKWFPDSELKTIPGVSHIPMIEAREEYLGIVDRIF